MTDALRASDSGELLQLRSDLHQHGATVHVMGEVDLVTAPSFAAELTRVEDSNPPPDTVVVNLSDVTFLSSAGLNVLVEHDRRCRANGHELRVVAGNRTVARAIGITGLTEILTVRDSVEDALR